MTWVIFRPVPLLVWFVQRTNHGEASPNPKESAMKDWVDFIATGLVVLPPTLGWGTDDADVFFVTLWVMLFAFLGTLLLSAKPPGLPPGEGE